MSKFIPLSVPNLKGKELEYVMHAVQTEWVSTGGPYVDEFEKKVANYVGVEKAVSCQNGTSGLHIALMLAGVEFGDEVIVPSVTFIAAVNPVRYLGANPVFMDCDDSLTLDVDKIKAFIEEQCSFESGVLVNLQSGNRIKAIVVVHVFGNLADMEKLMELAQTYNLKVVEDATEALGSYYTSGAYSGMHAGTIGDIGVYSFNGNKIITTGGGGMIVSRDSGLLDHAKHLTTQAKSNELYYTHDEIGFNYRMTNLQAALGLAQIEQLEKFVEIKHKNYLLYKNALDKIPGLKVLGFRDETRPNYWFYSLFCQPPFPLNRDQLIQYLSEKGIQTRPIWGLINEQKPYLTNEAYKIEKASQYMAHVVNLPCSSNLTEEDIRVVIETIEMIGG